VLRRRYASLLDDPSFIADLERVDLPVRTPLDKGADDVELLETKSGDLDDVVAWCKALPGPVQPAGPEHERGSAGRIVLGLAGFLVMMGIGAAAAAFVFADRVALLLGQ